MMWEPPALHSDNQFNKVPHCDHKMPRRHTVRQVHAIMHSSGVSICAERIQGTSATLLPIRRTYRMKKSNDFELYVSQSCEGISLPSASRSITLSQCVEAASNGSTNPKLKQCSERLYRTNGDGSVIEMRCIDERKCRQHTTGLGFEAVRQWRTSRHHV